MTYSITLNQLLAFDPCNHEERVRLFSGKTSLTAREALTAGVSIPDLLWVAGRMGLKHECVRFALACAQRTAHLNPDPRVSAALVTTSRWLSDPSEENRRAAAWAAVDAAWAAWAAVDAAWAAVDAARAAADAARAAADAAAWAAADAAAWAAAGAEQQSQREIFLEIFG